MPDNMPITVTHYLRKPHPKAFSIERLYEDVRAAMPKDCLISVWTCRHPSKGFLRRLQDIWLSRKAQSDVNHVTGDVHYLTYLLDRRRTILTIHDLVSFTRLRGFKRWLLWLLWYWLPVHRSAVVVVISESTRLQLLSNVKCNPDKIRVIHNSVSDEFKSVPAKFNIECPRILQVGTGANKNIEKVAEALSGISCILIVVGPLSADQLEILEKCEIKYENHVGLSRADLLEQYIKCDLVMFISIYEGFGLPIVEANAVGRPVIASATTSLPEVAGDAAALVDPLNLESIRTGLRRVIKDAHYREQLICNGLRNAERFKSAIVAKKYAELYLHVAAREGKVL